MTADKMENVGHLLLFNTRNHPVINDICDLNMKYRWTGASISITSEYQMYPSLVLDDCKFSNQAT